MKIGFSSLACPGWDFSHMVTQASLMGFDGLALRGLRGELDLTLVPELGRHPEGVRNLLSEHKVELVSLGTSVALDSKDRGELAHRHQVLAAHADLASRLGCRYVRLYVGEVQRMDNRRAALSRIAGELQRLVPVAARYGVTMIVENSGDFRGADDLWYLMDAVAHPLIRVCWNQFQARTQRERPTRSIPRLGRWIESVHLCDGRFADDGSPLDFVPLGEGETEVDRQIELLRGIGYGGYLIFEWPRLWMEQLPGPEVTLPPVAQVMREWLEAKQPVLSAYKGDKQAPRFARRKPATSVPGS